MPRPLRKIIQEVTYHCYSRCQDLNNLLLQEHGKAAFIEAIRMCQERYSFELNAAEMVANHTHLTVSVKLSTGRNIPWKQFLPVIC